MVLRFLVGSGAEPVGLWLTWVVGYGIHAALWAMGAAALTFGKNRSPSTRNMLWKVALVAPLATSALAGALPWGLERAHVEARYLRDVPVMGFAAPAETGWSGSQGLVAASGASASAKVDAPQSGPAGQVQDRGTSTGRVLAVSALVAGLLGLLRFTLSVLALRRNLRGRCEVRDEHLIGRLQRMRARAGMPPVSFTESTTIGSPMVVGTSEICIPRGLLDALSDAEIDSVLAHELAHLERHDGVWFPLVGLLQSILWLQPSHHWVASRFRQTAELACDDRAVELTGDPWGLASALTHLAACALLTPRGALVPTMARSASALLPRIQRLANAARTRVEPRTRGRRWGLVGTGAIGLLAVNLSVQAAPPPRASLEPPPDATATSHELAGLARRERQLEAELEITVQLPSAEQPHTPASVRRLELQQELRHVRSTQAWLETRFAEVWAKWAQRRASSRPARGVR